VGTATAAAELAVESPQIALSNVAATIVVNGAEPGKAVDLNNGGQLLRAVANKEGRLSFAGVIFPEYGQPEIDLQDASGQSFKVSMRVVPGWVSLLPPIVAVLCALTLRNAIPAMMFGIWIGGTALRSFTPGGVFNGLLDSFQRYVVEALADESHAAIILFSLMIGGMVGIITRNGGMTSIVRVMVSRARNAVGGQVAVWLMGLMIFFDDYSNTLVVGNTARPLTDHLKISREKLAYIVDSTAAPVVCLALITTWIGYEVGLIGESISGLSGIEEAPYTLFLHSIPYSFYPILTILFVLAVAWSGRDFGPMYSAEVRARRGQVVPAYTLDELANQGDQLEPKPGIPLRSLNALIPLLVLIFGLVGGLYVTGEGETISEIVGSADAYKAMMWASLLGAVAAALITLAQRILTVEETVDAWFSGVRAMIFSMIVLVLAWALSGITQQLHTADFLVAMLADNMPVALVPAAVFVLSALTAFATGTSWGTMGILMPLVISLAWAVLGSNGIADAEHMHILYSTIACNLAGAVWGDHCSPISDTTVLSSMASGCDHIEHVRTQLPYALVVGGVGLAIGTIPAGFGLPSWVSLLFAMAVLWGILRYFGRRADDAVNNAISN
jgi:Na+/H+ antiporter NhaC